MEKKWYFSISMLCCLASISAQESNGLQNFPAQMSIVYPMGTHGQQSVNYSYNLSFNLFYGKVGGVKGVEISGLFGNIKGDMTGFQIAGLGNASNAVSGIQIGGLMNASDAVKGIQIGGLMNASDAVKGIQIGGLGNASDNMKGIQIGGLGNIADDVNGIQIGGIYNRSGTMSGIGINGIYNRTKILRGFQIGLVSVNDTIEKGISLSLVNIVKRGFYKEWELSFSDYANVALSYKMGMQKFYTIYTVGANFIEDNLWIVGAGFGNRTSIGNRFDFQPELVSYNYFPTDFKNIQNTFATRMKFGFVYRINEKFGLSLAPSVYVMNTQKDSNTDSEFYRASPINAFYTDEKGNRQTTIGIGISLGLSIR
jgi:hypothetical protein